MKQIRVDNIGHQLDMLVHEYEQRIAELEGRVASLHEERFDLTDTELLQVIMKKADIGRTNTESATRKAASVYVQGIHRHHVPCYRKAPPPTLAVAPMLNEPATPVYTNPEATIEPLCKAGTPKGELI